MALTASCPISADTVDETAVRIGAFLVLDGGKHTRPIGADFEVDLFRFKLDERLARAKATASA